MRVLRLKKGDIIEVNDGAIEIIDHSGTTGTYWVHTFDDTYDADGEIVRTIEGDALLTDADIRRRVREHTGEVYDIVVFEDEEDEE